MAQGLRQNIWPLIEAGRIKPVIDSSFPLERLADAFRHQESNTHFGKICVEW